MVENCIFCQIVGGTAQTDIIYKDELVTAFHDRHPASPVHLLIVPNRHVPSLNNTGEEDEQLLGHIINVARRLAEQFQISQSGYRLLLNTGSDAGQTIFHLHLHLMGGRGLPGFTR